MLSNIKAINIILDGPPENIGGRFVEVETDDGKCVNAGEWTKREDGLWALRIKMNRPLTSAEEQAGQVACENNRLRIEVERLWTELDKLVTRIVATEDERVVSFDIMAAVKLLIKTEVKK